MNKKEIVLQIFTGGYVENPPSFEQIQEVLEPMLRRVPVAKIIMGWSVTSELYLKTIQLAKTYGTEVYLWLPVLSETGSLKPVQHLIDDEGKEVKAIQVKNGESFAFYCPNHPINQESFLAIYEEYFSKIPFDGVFLDKIRYSSFANGKSGAFSCFCPECRNEYAAAGIQTEQLLAEIQKVRNGDDEYQASPLGIKSYSEGKYQFTNPIWEKFFAYKQKKICSFLTSVTKKFRLDGLKIGLDTFSPFTAYFAGQDIVELAKTADFIKPMMYRVTQAPAGLFWEGHLLLQETLMNPSKNHFSKLLGMEQDMGIPFDLEFVKKELALLTAANIPLYPGIEINRIERIAETTPDYIRENVEELSKLPIRGFVLAWDLLSAPRENLEEVVRLFADTTSLT